MLLHGDAINNNHHDAFAIKKVRSKNLPLKNIEHKWDTHLMLLSFIFDVQFQTPVSTQASREYKGLEITK